MKIYSISDLHLSEGDKPMDVFGGNWENYENMIAQDWKNRVGNNDVVLICGDLCWAMKIENAGCLYDYLADLPGKKIVIRGNHDYWWKSISAVRDFLPSGCYALQNDAVKIGDYIFCGCRGWSTGDKNTAEDDRLFAREVLRMGLALDDAKRIRKDNEKIIVLTHFPPFDSKRSSNEMTTLFEQNGVTAVVYGHLHGKNIRADALVEKNGVKYYLTSCDQVDNKLVEIEG